MHQHRKQIFFPNLDGLRFLCFLSVFFFHSFATTYQNVQKNSIYRIVKFGFFRNGNLGVNFFFVLSGFLITYLLLTEKRNFEKIHVGSFYLRRILRIWPLFYFCVFFGFVLFPIFKSKFGGLSNETAHSVFYFFFANNFDYIKNGADSSVLSVLWSVAIEEQFYLLWPLILSFVPLKKIPHTFIALILLSFLFRFLNATNDKLIELHTFSCISDMIVGGLGAYFCFSSTVFVNAIKIAPKYLIVLVYIVTAFVYFFRQEIFHFNAFTLAIERLVISILFLFIILEQTYSDHSFYKMKNFKWISKLGQYTYGLYCLHMIAILAATIVLQKLRFDNEVWQVLGVEGLVSLAIALAIAYISYHFYEKRFLLLKNRFAFVNTAKSVSELVHAPKVIEKGTL